MVFIIRNMLIDWIRPYYRALINMMQIKFLAITLANLVTFGINTRTVLNSFSKEYGLSNARIRAMHLMVGS